MQRHIALQTVLVIEDEALQRSGFNYADRLTPEPTLSPWLICLTGRTGGKTPDQPEGAAREGHPPLTDRGHLPQIFKDR
jgi:hypothetical protein